MEIDISIGEDSLSMNLKDPHRFSESEDLKGIVDFGRNQGVDMVSLQVDQLIQRMIRGVAGCEGGCPADAKGLVRDGFGRFNLSYVEGGILSAVCGLEDGNSLSIRIFPEFS
jgi:hypothetical protein